MVRACRWILAVFLICANGLDDELSLLQIKLNSHEKTPSRSVKGQDEAAALLDTSRTVESSTQVAAGPWAEWGKGVKQFVKAQTVQVTTVNRYPAIFQGLKQLLHQRSGLKLLSFGCSDGSEPRTLRHHFPSATIHGVDVDSVLIDRNSVNNVDASTRYFNSTSSLEPETYDAVLAMGVLCRQTSASDRLPYATYLESMQLIDQLVRPGGFMVLYNADFPFSEYPYNFRYKNAATNCKGSPTTIMSADQRVAQSFDPDSQDGRGVCSTWGKFCIESGFRAKFTYAGERVQPPGDGYASYGCMYPGTFFQKQSAIPNMSPHDAQELLFANGFGSQGMMNTGMQGVQEMMSAGMQGGQGGMMNTGMQEAQAMMSPGMQGGSRGMLENPLNGMNAATNGMNVPANVMTSFGNNAWAAYAGA